MDARDQKRIHILNQIQKQSANKKTKIENGQISFGDKLKDVEKKRYGGLYYLTECFISFFRSLSPPRTSFALNSLLLDGIRVVFLQNPGEVSQLLIWSPHVDEWSILSTILLQNPQDNQKPTMHIIGKEIQISHPIKSVSNPSHITL